MISRKLLRVFHVRKNLSKLLVAIILLGSAMSGSNATNHAATQAPTSAGQNASVDSLDAWLDSLRAQQNIPAMAAIVMRADTILVRGVARVRRSGVPGAITVQDRFQLGSNTKAITATLIATFVEAGKLSWATTLGDIFPEIRDSMSSEFKGATVEQLLSHHAHIVREFINAAFKGSEDRFR
jgi:CubicO group peptidase (beta-lactamase class C family)